MTALSNCRIYLISPPHFELAKFTDDLAQAVAVGDAASLLLRMPGAEDDDIRQAVKALTPACQAHDVALIVDQRADIAAETLADGVHVDAAAYHPARALMGPDRIVGVTSIRSRHRAMEAADMDADFVAFSAPGDDAVDTAAAEGELFSLAEMMGWWRDLIEVPCVATAVECGGLSLADCAALAEAGADFVAVGEAVWSHPEGPAAGLKAANAAIGGAISVALEQPT